LEDIYILNADTLAGAKRFGDHLFAFRNGERVDLFALPENHGAINRVAGRSVCALDRHGMGTYGMVVANYGGPMRLYERTDGDVLYDHARQARIAFVTGGRSLIALPLVSPPGQLDLFAATENGPNLLFRSNGDGTFTEMAAEAGLTDEWAHGRGVAALDADSTGLFDLVIGNWQDEHRFRMQTAPGIFADAATPEMRRPSAVRTVIVADFDNDGHEEIFFNNIGEPNRLFAQRFGYWNRVEIGDAEEPNGYGTGAAVADLDGDGRLELLIAHGEQEAQPLSLYHAAPTPNHYLRIQPLTRAGAPARGAFVALTAGGRTQRRVIDGGSGYLCQMEPVAHFGLGSVRQVDRVRIVWPGGATAVLETPQIDGTIRVPYPVNLIE
ncbi:MAG: CRTAC1 family protein, partial [Capsulimonadales bacterium]|nr:CRTAC1 family protein [Capsulimonadales bacterium]